MSGDEGQDGSRGPALIDVLVPVYNARTTLEASVRSILEQTERDLRLILVDDGSIDGSAEMMDAFAAADPRVTVHHQPNGGIVDALNAGLALCTAEFIARHDADDLAAPDRLARQLAYLRAHEDCVAVGSRARHIDAQGRETGTYADPGPTSRADPTRAPSREPYLMHPFLLVRREALRQVGGYRYAFHAEDTDLYWRLLDHGRLHNLADILGDYRLHEGSVSSLSLINGRIAALEAQLAAVSARRRARGAIDLDFPRERLSQLTAAGTLARMIEVFAAELSSDELAYLRVATAAKMMELTRYRPYELDPGDTRFIAGMIRRDLDELSHANGKEVRAMVRPTVARLLRKGRFAAARPLLTARMLPAVVARAAVQAVVRALPPALLRPVRRLQRRGQRTPAPVAETSP